MPKRGKKYRQVVELVDKTKEYSVEEAIELAKKVSYTKFDATLEFHGVLNLGKGVDPRSIKFQITFPHAFKQKPIKIAVAVPVDLKEKAKEAGADFYDLNEIFKQIESGKMEFDILLAMPQVMPQLAKYGKQLGPKGLMPNAKTGTIVDVNNMKQVIEDFRKGKYLVKVDKTSVIHFPFGVVSMPTEALLGNLRAVLKELVSVTGRSLENLIKKAYITPTMGPAIKVNVSSLK